MWRCSNIRLRVSGHVLVEYKTIAINGCDLYYSEEGAGEPLILVHGFGSCSSDWGAFTYALAKSYRVISLNMRGHGLSTNPSGRFSHKQSREDIKSLLENLGTERTRAIGFSSGAMSLPHAASRHACLFSKLVLVSGTTYFADCARRIMRRAAFETLPPQVREQFVRCALRGEGQARELIIQFNNLAESYDDMDLTGAELAKIEAETFVIHGDRDEFFPVAIPVAMFEAIPKTQLWIVPNGGHCARAGASEVEFQRQVSRFLAE